MQVYEIQYKKPSTIHLGKVSKLLALLFLVFACAAKSEIRHFEDWTKKEQLLFSGYTLAAYVDHKQTQWALNHPCNCFSEENTLIYGNNPSKDKSLIINGLLLSGLYYMIGSYEPDDLVPALIGGNIGRWGVVAHNDHIGVSISVAF